MSRAVGAVEFSGGCLPSEVWDEDAVSGDYVSDPSDDAPPWGDPRRGDGLGLGLEEGAEDRAHGWDDLDPGER